MTLPNLARLRALPKVDLHRHLEGSLRPETLWELHYSQKQTLHASLDALRAACTIAPGQQPRFLGFLNCFSGLRFKYGNMQALERLAAEAVADAAADGVVHLELRFSPVFFAHRTYDATPSSLMVPEPLERVEAAAHAIISGAEREARARNISVAFLITMRRDLGLAVNRPAADLLERPIGKRLAGLDLAGDEAHPAAEFREVFKAWQAAGRGVTVHAGEAPGPHGARNVRDAVSELNATRIGHGVRVIEDKDALAFVAARKTPLEVCLTFNVQTAAAPDYGRHQLKQLLDAQALVTLNTDDPALSRITLSDEYLRALDDCKIGWSALRQCALNAAFAAFLSSEQKAALADKLSAAWPENQGN